MHIVGMSLKRFFAPIQFCIDYISDRLQTRQTIFQKALRGRLTFLRTFFRLFVVFECGHRFSLLDYGKVRPI